MTTCCKLYRNVSRLRAEFTPRRWANARRVAGSGSPGQTGRRKDSTLKATQSTPGGCRSAKGSLQEVAHPSCSPRTNGNNYKAVRCTRGLLARARPPARFLRRNRRKSCLPYRWGATANPQPDTGWDPSRYPLTRYLYQFAPPSPLAKAGRILSYTGDGTESQSR